MELERFCVAHLEAPWAPGRVDCLLALADWACALGYPDPAADLRGSYDDAAGFRAIVEAAGGAVGVVQACADRLGVARIEAPRHGCAAVVGSRRDPQRQWGGIWDAAAGGWRVRFDGGYPAVRAHALAMWGL